MIVQGAGRGYIAFLQTSFSASMGWLGKTLGSLVLSILVGP